LRIKVTKTCEASWYRHNDYHWYLATSTNNGSIADTIAELIQGTYVVYIPGTDEHLVTGRLDSFNFNLENGKQVVKKVLKDNGFLE